MFYLKSINPELEPSPLPDADAADSCSRRRGIQALQAASEGTTGTEGLPTQPRELSALLLWGDNLGKASPL